MELDVQRTLETLDSPDMARTAQEIITLTTVSLPKDVQAPILRGVTAAGVPLESAIALTVDIITNPKLNMVRRSAGDLTVGVAAGLTFHEQAELSEADAGVVRLDTFAAPRNSPSKWLQERALRDSQLSDEESAGIA